MKRYKKTAVLLGLGMAIGLHRTELALNRTSSLPYSVFLIIKGMPVSKGSLASLKGHPTKYFKEGAFTKRVLGVARDKTQGLASPLKKTTKQGKPLTPLKAELIPNGFLFVGTDHPDSFDSRYEEFGLVSLDHVVGRAFPLW